MLSLTLAEAFASPHKFVTFYEKKFAPRPS
jgi:hypothetical protein